MYDNVNHTNNKKVKDIDASVEYLQYEFVMKRILKDLERKAQQNTEQNVLRLFNQECDNV